MVFDHVLISAFRVEEDISEANGVPSDPQGVEGQT
jgi:hypothetical protein